MKLKIFLTYSDGQDGSYFVTMQNTEEDALKQLGSTKEEVESGNFYEHGHMEEIELEIENGKLVKPVKFSVE